MIHNNKYLYKKTQYSSRYKKVTITCPIHGDFEQDVYHHLNGHGCPKCNQSFLEREMIELLENNSIKYKYNKRYKILDNLQLDFYLPKHNIAIECQGWQHFKPIIFFGGEDNLNKTKLLDDKKSKLCKQNNIKLLYYSNLNIEYPYHVYTNKYEILNVILNEENRYK